MNQYKKRFQLIKNHCEDEEILQLFKNSIALSINYGGEDRLLLIELLLDELIERGFDKEQEGE